MNKETDNIEIVSHENYTVSHFNFIANIFIKERNHNLQYLHDEIFPSKIDNCKNIIVTEARVNDTLIAGCVSYIWNGDVTNIHIAYFAIDPNYRDKKLGREMLKCLRRYVLSLQSRVRTMSLYVNVENFNAIGLYIKQGFNIIECMKEGYNANIGYYLMRKDL